jgi:hypothetical protein
MNALNMMQMYTVQYSFLPNIFTNWFHKPTLVCNGGNSTLSNSYFHMICFECGISLRQAGGRVGRKGGGEGCSSSSDSSSTADFIFCYRVHTKDIAVLY